MTTEPNPSPLLATALAIACTLTAASAQVSPADRADVEGSASTSYPLGRHDARYQQLHADLSPGGARTLQGHAYRRDAVSTRGTLTAFSVDLEVTAATAPHLPAAAQRDFATNLGADATSVLPRTTVSFPATGRPDQAPAAAFAYRIPWTNPFPLAQGATLCLDLTVHGNTTSAGNDRNFGLLLDAQEWNGDGSTAQPGYRFGDGCAPRGGSRPHSARFELLRRADGSLALDLASRDGIPGGPLALVLGAAISPTSWPDKPNCRLLPTLDATFNLPGSSDPGGDWNGTLGGLPQLASGQQFVLQMVTAGFSPVDLTFSDGSVLTVPPVLPSVQPAARIASGSDRTATRGTVSSTVTVTSFF